MLLGTGLTAQTVSVAGQVTGGGEPFSNVTISITTAQETLTTITDEAGNYSFENVPQDALVTLEPIRTINPLNGVSTFDIVLGLKHALGITPFDLADSYLAMDVNNSGSVTVLDLVILRQLILNIIQEIPDTNAWRFIEANQLANITFDQRESPEYTTGLTAIDFTPNADGVVILNFVGIKLGDANGSASSDF